MPSLEDRHYAMGVLAAKNAMRDGNAFAAMCNQAEEVLAKEPIEVEVVRLREALVTVKVNLMRDGPSEALYDYISKQLQPQ